MTLEKRIEMGHPSLDWQVNANVISGAVHHPSRTGEQEHPQTAAPNEQEAKV